MKAVALSLVLGAVASTADAHSLEAMERALGDREKYFQVVDKPAPDFALADADGAIVRLADFRDKVVVIHFVYTNCPDVCPLHAEKIAEVQAMVNRTPMKDGVRFVTVTTDPAKDTPDVLRAYGTVHGLDSVNWAFLTAAAGQPGDVTRRLAERFGQKFTETKDGYQMHAVATYVIDREGRWRATFHGLRFGATNLVLYLNALVNDRHPPDMHRDRSLGDRIRGLLGRERP